MAKFLCKKNDPLKAGQLEENSLEYKLKKSKNYYPILEGRFI